MNQLPERLFVISLLPFALLLPPDTDTWGRKIWAGIGYPIALCLSPLGIFAAILYCVVKFFYRGFGIKDLKAKTEESSFLI